MVHCLPTKHTAERTRVKAARIKIRPMTMMNTNARRGMMMGSGRLIVGEAELAAVLGRGRDCSVLDATSVDDCSAGFSKDEETEGTELLGILCVEVETTDMCVLVEPLMAVDVWRDELSVEEGTEFFAFSLAEGM